MENEQTARLNYCYKCMRQLEEGVTICPVCGHDNSRRTNPGNALQEGTILDGKFLVGRVLGQGGFGITYLGLDLTLDVRVAIKEYFPVGVGMRDSHSCRVTSVSQLEDPDGFRKGCDEFQAEAKTLARFNSPNIVHVREYFRENGTAYIVMDYIDGVTLTKEAELCGGKMPWERVVSLFTPLMKELGKLHEEHLVHRDIKPDNLKLVKDRKSGEEHLVLLDFGSARSFVSENVTKTYTAMVTPGYAPIEQYSAKSRQGPYTDVYSLSATMYALITGEVPATATDRLSGIDDIQPIHTKEADIPESVEKAILHGMEGHSVDRPQTMRALYDELTGESVSVKTQKIERPKERKEPGKEPKIPVYKNKVERPEKVSAPAKKRNLWIIPLLIALFAGGYFLSRNIGQQGKSAIPTQTAAGQSQNAVSAMQTGAPGSAPTKTPAPTSAKSAIPAPTDTSFPVIPPTAEPFVIPTKTTEPFVIPTKTTEPFVIPTKTTEPFVIPTKTTEPVRPTFTPVSEEAYYYEYFTTSEYPRQADFLWVTEDILEGNLPAGRTRLSSIISLMGGWKVYIVDNPENRFGSGMERLCNADVDAGQFGPQVILHWYYVYNRDTQAVNRDLTPDSRFTNGTWNNGSMEATGSGKIELTEFYYLNGKEYAVGLLYWPDGVKAAVFMVRP